jgi:uncharacterized protein (TIGR03437 family)
MLLSKARSFTLLSLGMFESLAAQATAQPSIGAVVDAATFAPPVSPNSWATVFGTGLATGVYQANSLPLPTNLGGTEVLLCPDPYPSSQIDTVCASQQIDYVSPKQINFLVSLPTNFAWPCGGWACSTGAWVLVRVNGVVSPSPGARTSLSLYAPGIFPEGYDCWYDPNAHDPSPCVLTWTPINTNEPFRGAITDQNYRLLTSLNPARIDQYYTIWLTGLGQLSATPVQDTTVAFMVPVYGYDGPTTYQVPALYVGLTTYAGLYQINFRLSDSILGGGSYLGYPPRWPCGTQKWDITLNLFYRDEPTPAQSFDLVNIPVLVQDSDRPDCH